MTINLPIAVLLTLAAIVGQACILMATVNYLYGERISKKILKPVRLLFGSMTVGLPLLLILISGTKAQWFVPDGINGQYGWLVQGWFTVLLFYGLIVFPAITLVRCFTPNPKQVLSEKTETINLWPKHGPALKGDGKWRWATGLPFNQFFRQDFTELELQLEQLPPGLDGLTVHLISDLHFIGTPSKLYYEELIARMNQWPVPDVLVLAGDYVDGVEYHKWIQPMLGQLKWKEAAYAVMGNHDEHFHPNKIRTILSEMGCIVLGNHWQHATLKGVPLVVAGHEGPWFRPPTDLSDAPADLFRLCVSHSPDNFPWAVDNGVNFMLCGHVHGGQVRVPVIGSIFVPSVYGRRYDMGVFHKKQTTMVVSRGVAGKEPIRFQCNAQVMRITLKAKP